MESHSQQDRIWEYLQSNEPEAFAAAKPRLAFLINILKSKGKNRVLNIGIGSGFFEKLALKKGLEVVSLDPDAKTVERIKSELKIEAEVGYSHELPFPDASFDAVVMSEVLEHIPLDGVEGTVKDINRVLKKGGYYLGSVPREEDIKKGTVVCPQCGNIFHKIGHNQSFSVEKLHRILGEYFTVEKVIAKYFTDFSALSWKGKIIMSLHSLLYNLSIIKSGGNLVFLARKDQD
jgi:SAM-dependent methyltransferase